MAKSKKRTQIENRLAELGYYLGQCWHDGRRVWYAGCPAGAWGLHKYTLHGEIACGDWWYTLDTAHAALFDWDKVRADNLAEGSGRRIY